MNEEIIGKEIAGKYRIEEIIRESEFGNTYRGTHLSMDMPVTIKILSPTLAVDESIVEKFSLEARTISRLSHPNVLNVTDFGKDEDGIVYIVTEDAEGENLKEIIKRDGAFSIEKAVRVARQIAAALSSAHASRLVHKSLTSDKVLLATIGNDTELVKVSGLGSFEVDEPRDFENEEDFQDLAYLSPEQCTQESEPDERSDIYSLGIIFYEMLTGEVPFTADTATDLMMKHSQSPPPALVAFRADIPEEIEPILLNALSKNPDKRYQSAAAFAEDLSDAIKTEDEDETIVIPKVNAAAAGADANANNVWKTSFIVLAGISLLAFGFIYWTNTTQTDPTTVRNVDKDGKPVQPINPATGITEQNRPSMDSFPTDPYAEIDPSLYPTNNDGGSVSDGGSYPSSPWDNGGYPPPGAPIGVGGETVTIPGDGNSIFMPTDDGTGVILVPRPVKPEEEKKDNKEKTDKRDEKTKPENKIIRPGENKPNVDPKKPTENPKVDPKKPADKPKVETPKKPVENKTKTDKPKPQPSSKNKKIKSGVKQDVE